jgi:hypothetical protein
MTSGGFMHNTFYCIFIDHDVSPEKQLLKEKHHVLLLISILRSILLNKR